MERLDAGLLLDRHSTKTEHHSLCRKELFKSLPVWLRDATQLECSVSKAAVATEVVFVGGIKEQTECRYERVTFGNKA